MKDRFKFIAEVPEDGDYIIKGDKLYIVSPDKEPVVIDLITGRKAKITIGDLPPPPN
tara:strand:+ start:2980 stop:3150 length:171 start_codon:yes stop_codon:yes gene_type:complete